MRTRMAWLSAFLLMATVGVFVLLPSRRDRIVLRGLHMIEDRRSTLDGLTDEALRVRAGAPRGGVTLFQSELGMVEEPPAELLDSCAYRIRVGSIGVAPSGSAFYVVRITDPSRAIEALGHSQDLRFIFVTDSYGLLAWR